MVFLAGVVVSVFLLGRFSFIAAPCGCFVCEVSSFGFSGVSPFVLTPIAVGTPYASIVTCMPAVITPALRILITSRYVTAYILR